MLALLGWRGCLYPVLRISVGSDDPNGMWTAGVTLHAYAATGRSRSCWAHWSIPFRWRSSSGRSASGSVSPLTYLITRMRRRVQVVWLVFLLATLSLSDVLIAFSWQVMLSKRIGLVEHFRGAGADVRAGIADAQQRAVIACLVYLVLPFTVLTLFPVLSRLNYDLIEAARNPGASPNARLCVGGGATDQSGRGR